MTALKARVDTRPAFDRLDPVELVPKQLYLLGGSIRLDGRISWVPAELRGWQPINTYVLREGDSILLIDPGVYAQHDIVRGQLERLVPAGSPIALFVTRAEPDATGNIGEIASRYPVTTLYAGGGPNPFDAFEAVGLMDVKRRGERIQMERLPTGYQVPVAEGRGMEILRPIIRLLGTYWGYDSTTRTLFTSDSFSHVTQTSPDGPRVVDASGPGVDRAAMKAHLLAKFGWLANAKTQSILTNLHDMRLAREIDRIAPGRGLVIEGRDVVRQHLDTMESILGELAS